MLGEIFHLFECSWVFDLTPKEGGHRLKYKVKILYVNAIKAGN